MTKFCGLNRALGLMFVGAWLVGVGCKRLGTPESAPPIPVPVSSEGTIRVTVDQKGYEPSAISAPAGKPLTLIFRRVSDVGCGDEVVFPKHGIKKDLPLNEDVAVTITPQASQEVQFTCGMGMYKGAIVVDPL